MRFIPLNKILTLKRVLIFRTLEITFLTTHEIKRNNRNYEDSYY